MYRYVAKQSIEKYLSRSVTHHGLKLSKFPSDNSKPAILKLIAFKIRKSYKTSREQKFARERFIILRQLLTEASATRA